MIRTFQNQPGYAQIMSIKDPGGGDRQWYTLNGLLQMATLTRCGLGAQGVLSAET